jgi:hypothetical protein
MNGIEEETFPPKYNGYVCTSCKKQFLTVELAEGKTPHMMTCLRTKKCNGVAMTMGHVGSIGLGAPLLMEFVKPDEEDMEKAKTVMPQLYAYFRNGGLMRRAVDTAPNWVKALA